MSIRPVPIKMICPKCRKEYDHTWKVCLDCQVPLKDIGVYDKNAPYIPPPTPVEKRITKEEVIKFVKIAFRTDVLIKVALILGIMFLSVSLLKSCGVIDKKTSFRRF